MTHLLASDVVWLAVQIGTILNSVLLVYVAVMVTKGRKS